MLEFLHTGHLVHVEKPHEFIQTVTKFINREFEIAQWFRIHVKKLSSEQIFEYHFVQVFD